MLPTRRFIPLNPTKLCKNLISFNQKRTQFNCQTSLREHYCHNEELISNFPSIKLLHESSAFTAGLNLDKNEHVIALAHNPSNSHYLQLLEKVSHQMRFQQTNLEGILGKKINFFPLLNTPNICLEMSIYVYNKYKI